jgi:hypothetical protein
MTAGQEPTASGDHRGTVTWVCHRRSGELDESLASHVKAVPGRAAQRSDDRVSRPRTRNP